MSHTEINEFWWPALSSTSPPSGIVVVSANYNTKPLIAQLIWSLYRFLGPELRSIVIVDNGSTDGSVELLRALAEAGLCQLLANEQNRNHGPALSQGISHLARQHATAEAGECPWIWLLDSDCLIARADAATDAVAAATAAGAALVGQPYWNPWHNEERFSGFSLLLDPARAWRADLGPLPDGGDPVGDFVQAARAQGVPTHPFPFTVDGYLIHLGRSTLAGIYQRGETSNEFYEWAQEHHDPHFQDAPHGQAQHAALIAEFEQQVPDLRAELLMQACQEKE